MIHFKATTENGTENFIEAYSMFDAMKIATDEFGSDIDVETATAEEVCNECIDIKPSEYIDVTEIFDDLDEFNSDADTGNKILFQGEWYIKIRIDTEEGQLYPTMKSTEHGWEEQ